MLTSREEESQPLECRERGLALAFCGRVDNRAELLRSLDCADPEWSDARMVLESWRRWGETTLEKVLGPYSLALVDRRARTVLLARDPLAQRGLVFVSDGERLVAATEEAALLAEGTATAEPNDGALSRLFANASPDPEWTFFRDIRRVAPGSLVRWRRGSLRAERYWRPTEPTPIQRSDGEHTEAVRAALAAAVERRLRGRCAPAVMMSGGLDSTTVAAWMARLLPDRPMVISWMFDALPEADERDWIEAMRDECGLEHVGVPADGEWPLRRLGSRPVNPNAPIENLYCGLVDETYRRVRASGRNVVLNGEYGDHLYLDQIHWLEDRWAAGRYVAAIHGVVRELALHRHRREAGGPTLRGAVGCLLGRSPQAAPPPFLTPFAREHWRPPPAHPSRASAAWDRILHAWDARFSEWEARRAAQLGVEVRRPYRDLRLIETFLELPADQLFDPPWTKAVTRRAMAGILPETVRLRTRRTTLLPLASRGIDQRERAAVASLLGSEDALWPRYVQRSWVLPEGAASPAPLVEGRGSFLVWLAITTELWARTLRSGDVEGGAAAVARPAVPEYDAGSQGRG